MRLQWVSLSLIILILIALLITGCSAFEDPSKRATANAEDTAVVQTISVVEIQIETMVALQATADSAALLNSQVTQVAATRNALQATVNALQGNPIVTQPTSVGPPATAIDGGAPAGPQPTATTADVVQYASATTATSIDDTSFCATSPVTVFGMGTDVIYFVVVARNVPRGVSFSLHVTQEGQTRARDTNFWVSDNFYDQTCIYYGIDDNNFTFEAGTYIAELLANNVVVQQATFQIQ